MKEDDARTQYPADHPLDHVKFRVQGVNGRRTGHTCKPCKRHLLIQPIYAAVPALKFTFFVGANFVPSL